MEVSGAGAHGEFDVQVLTPTLVGVDKGAVRGDKAVFDVVAGTWKCVWGRRFVRVFLLQRAVS